MRTYAIALVGLDGAGKTTQASALARRLRDGGCEAVAVHPSNDLVGSIPGGERIKAGLLGWLGRPTLASRASRRLLMVLFGYPFALVSLALARHRHRGRVIVFDRYRYQFLYDCYGPLAPLLVRALPTPDRTIWLAADVETLYERMGDGDRERPPAYYRSADWFHDRLARERGWTRIETDRPLDRVIEEVFASVVGPAESRSRSPNADPRTGG
ncbi:MAG: hypothetical protein QXG03_02990 [Halalkalicoccus sp.]